MDALSLYQAELAGARDRFGAPLDLEFAKDLPVVAFHCVQGQKQALADLLIGEPLSHKMEHF